MDIIGTHQLFRCTGIPFRKTKQTTKYVLPIDKIIDVQNSTINATILQGSASSKISTKSWTDPQPTQEVTMVPPLTQSAYVRQYKEGVIIIFYTWCIRNIPIVQVRLSFMPPQVTEYRYRAGNLVPGADEMYITICSHS